MNIERGDIYYIRPHITTGSEIWSGRPAIVVSSDRINHTGSTVEVVYLTTQPRADLPTHVTIRSSSRDSIALCEQISTVALERVGTYAGHITEAEMAQLEIAMMISLAIKCTAAPVLAEEKQDPVYPPPRGRAAGPTDGHDHKVRNVQIHVRLAAGSCAAAA